MGKYEPKKTVNYDEFYLKPVNERINIFKQISAENRAFLVKTHAGRWLSANRSRLNEEQAAVVKEMIESILPEWYEDQHNIERINHKTESLIKKVEAVLTREDLIQLATNQAEYIPVQNTNS